VTFDRTRRNRIHPNPDGLTLITKDYLDGSPASDGGTGQTPTTYLEGVAGSTPDPTDPASADPQIIPGSTWSESSTDGGANWTRTYTNALGEQYLTQESGPSSTSAESPGQAAYVDSITKFDGNLRPTETIGFDGSKSFNVYNPVTGLLAASWTSMDDGDTFNAASDSKTIYAPTAMSTSASSPAGSDTKILSNGGTLDDNATTSNGGLNSSDTTNGLTTTTETIVDGNGSYRVFTTNPDGTQEQDTYTDGLLTDQLQLDNGEGAVADTTYVYNPNRTLDTSTDYTGVTTYAYFQDGTEQSVKLPGHETPSQTVTAINSNTESATTVKNANGTSTSQSPNPLGQTSSQSGAGVIAAGFGYDTQGRLTSLTTYSTGEVGNINDPDIATTTWEYDPATGQLQSKIYQGGSHTDYSYNAAGQLKGVTGPDLTGTDFVYNAAGQLTDSSFTDTQTGLVRSKLTVDDQGRPSIATSTDNGKTFSNVTTYTALGQPQNETFGSAGGAIVAHGYYPVIPGANDASPTTESPDALSSLTIQSLPNGQANAATTYGYDAITKRLKTIRVNGVTFTIAYLPNSNQIASITAGTVTTTFTPDGADAARLYAINASANGNTLYNAALGYSDIDQINNERVQQEYATNDGSSYNSYTYVYDPTQANALTQVKDSAGNILYSYSYDGVGNAYGASLGAANDLNQYSVLSYNARGDVIDDGTYAYTYDANDRMISVTPHDTTQPKLTYGYDSQGRRLWKDVYNFDTETDEWDLAYSRHYVYDGTNLVGELDANNTLLTGYTWGANGQLLAVTDYTQATPKTYVAVIDASGNTALLIDPTAGTVAASYTYDPFGNLLTATGPAQGICSILGKGLYYDAEARSLWHAGLRDGRNNIWYERDKAGEIAGGINLYEMYGNDPINSSDTSGLAPTKYLGLPDEVGEPLMALIKAADRASPTGTGVHQHVYYMDLLRERIEYAKSMTGGSLQGLSGAQIYVLAQRGERAEDNAENAYEAVIKSGYDPGMQNYHASAIENRIVGGSNATGAASAAILAAPAVLTGVGATGELYLIDQFFTGLKQAFTGVQQQSTGSQVVQSVIQSTGIQTDPVKSRETADIVYNLVGIAANLKAGWNLAHPPGLPKLPPIVAAESAGPSQILSGHGWYDAANGLVRVPAGTSVTVVAEHGQPILDSVGGLIDQGIVPPAEDILGARSYLPGSTMPSYTLHPPIGLNIMGNPTTVIAPTNLDLLLQPNQGNVWWSACQSLK
jgi:hypothetical protein